MLLSRSWFVAPGGKDANSGSITLPLRTIQRAATLAQPGDTVYLRAGTYHETVTPARSGTAATPITYAAYNGERVTIDGADPVTGWGAYRGSINQASQPWTLGEGDDQVFVDGRMVNEARWPNTSLDLSHPATASIRTASTTAALAAWMFPATATVSSSNLPGRAGAWNGATIHVASGQGWVFQTGAVVSSGNGSLTYAYQHFGNYGIPSAGNRFYLSGKFQALDAPGEWYRDPGTGRLYLWTPAGDSPARHGVEAKHRLYGFELSGRSYINIQGINLFACTIDTNASSFITISGMNAQYVSHDTNNPVPWDGNNRTGSTGIILRGSHLLLRDSTIAYSSGDGVDVSGSDDTVQNCVVHDVDYAAGDEGAITVMGLRQQIVGNTIYNAGRNGILYTDAVASKILRNVVHDVGLQTTDLGGIYGWGTDGRGTEIAYNTVYNVRTRGFGAGGIYLDNGSSNFVVHDNVISNVDVAIKYNPPANGIVAYHNTVNGRLTSDVRLTPRLQLPNSIAGLTDLGTLGGFQSHASGINDAGQIVGQSATGSSVPAFLYSGGAMRNLGTFGGNYSTASAINSGGQVTGAAYGITGRRHTFLFSGGRLSDLGTLSGDIASYGTAINSSGTVVGVSYNQGAVNHAFVDIRGRMQSLGTLGGTQAGAYGINDLGQIVGASGVRGDRASHAFLYLNGRMTDLGTLGGTNSAAYAINNRGEIVGQSSTARDAAQHAFLWSGGRMRDLGSLTGFPNTVATAINDNGDVVGYAYSSDYFRWHAFVYHNGVLRDLNSYLPAGSGWTLTSADDINNRGQIVGAANTPSGQMRAFLLSVLL